MPVDLGFHLLGNVRRVEPLTAEDRTELGDGATACPLFG
jgi:hypothetical protein